VSKPAAISPSKGETICGDHRIFRGTVTEETRGAITEFVNKQKAIETGQGR